MFVNGNWECQVQALPSRPSGSGSVNSYAPHQSTVHVNLAQNPNPQQSYVQTVEARHPCPSGLWLRFNGSSATNFLDECSGLNFTAAVTVGELRPSHLDWFLLAQDTRR